MPTSLERYIRQRPLLTNAGQHRLRHARVLQVDVGELGSSAAMYLTGAGVGHLTLADSDTVQHHNLHRQVLYATAEQGQPKVDRARDRLNALNEEVRIETLTAHLAGQTLHNAVATADVVLDCTDNLATRYALNAACIDTATPLISGSVERMHGQLMVIAPPFSQGCYACLYPMQDAPPPPTTPISILGPIAGVIGTLQALEAIRLMTEGRSPLSDTLTLFDGNHLHWRTLRRTRTSSCPVCGETQCA